jgi:glycosyltransferase involved in cell wall biosynthesis
VLLIAGEPVSDDLRRLIDSEVNRPGIVRLGHLTEQELSAAGAAIDCCINPRWPAAGETSGIAIRMMGLGKPVILTESAEIEDFPEGVRLAVRPGAHEIEDLLAQMALVTDFPALAREIGAAARRHIETRHQLSEVAARYLDILLSAG